MISKEELEEIESFVQVRIQQAKEKNYPERCRLIVSMLSKLSTYPSFDNLTVIVSSVMVSSSLKEEGMFKDDNFHIDYHAKVHNPNDRYYSVDITYADDLVFVQQGDQIQGYIPGPWEAKFDSLHLRAASVDAEAKEVERKRLEEADAQVREYRREDIRMRFGI